MSKAKLLYQQGKLRDAIEELTKEVKASPGNTELRSFRESEKTRERMLVASRSSSVTVLVSRVRGLIMPCTRLPPPTAFTSVSSTQYQCRPVAASYQSLAAMPWMAGTEPV